MSNADRQTRSSRVERSLLGLSVGDAFGEQFFADPRTAEERIDRRLVPPSPWPFTDDTVMAASVVEVLAETGRIDQDRLSARFGDRYLFDRGRGYGGTAHGLLTRVAAGEPWREVAASAFGGGGSMGNGGAMRSAPVGAYFSDDLGRVVEEARASAEVTHAHPEGCAGAIAVAVAAAWVAAGGVRPADLFDCVLSHTPHGETFAGIRKAAALPAEYDVRTAVSALGNGSCMVSQDTVPFALWCAAAHLDDYQEALWKTVSGLGDRDTTCAIVGGIVALHPAAVVPPAWLAAREPLDRVRAAAGASRKG